MTGNRITMGLLTCLVLSAYALDYARAASSHSNDGVQTVGINDVIGTLSISPESHGTKWTYTFGDRKDHGSNSGHGNGVDALNGHNSESHVSNKLNQPRPTKPDYKPEYKPLYKPQYKPEHRSEYKPEYKPQYRPQPRRGSQGSATSNTNVQSNGFGNNGAYASANAYGRNAHATATATATGNGHASANAVANAHGISNRFSGDSSNDFGYHGNSNMGDIGINIDPRFVNVDESGTFDNARGVFSSSSASMGPNGQGSYRVRSGKIPNLYD